MIDNWGKIESNVFNPDDYEIFDYGDRNINQVLNVLLSFNDHFIPTLSQLITMEKAGLLELEPDSYWDADLTYDVEHRKEIHVLILLKEEIMKTEKIVKEFMKDILELDVEPDESNDVCGSIFIQHEDKEYSIFTEEQREEAVRDYILDTVEHFRPSFLARITGLPEDAFKLLADKIYSQDVFNALIKATCGFDKLTREAIESDGYGFFLSPYDGEELLFKVFDGWESETYYAYRVN